MNQAWYSPVTAFLIKNQDPIATGVGRKELSHSRVGCHRDFSFRERCPHGTHGWCRHDGVTNPVCGADQDLPNFHAEGSQRFHSNQEKAGLRIAIPSQAQRRETISRGDPLPSPLLPAKACPVSFNTEQLDLSVLWANGASPGCPLSRHYYRFPQQSGQCVGHYSGFDQESRKSIRVPAFTGMTE